MSATERVWVRHPETDAVKEIAASAVPVMARGGWQPLSAAELKQLVEDQDAERAARLDALTPSSARADAEPPAARPAKSASAGKTDKTPAAQAKSEKQES